MSDYLGHLVARTLSATESVRPRVRSYFEPSVTNGWPAFHPLTEMKMSGIEQEQSAAAAPPERFSQLDGLWTAPPGGPIEQPRRLAPNVLAAASDQEEVVPERRNADRKAVFPPQSIGASSGPEADTRKLAQPEKRAFHRSTQMEMPAIEQEQSAAAAPPERFSQLDGLWTAPPGGPIEQPRRLAPNVLAAASDQEEVAPPLVPERRNADPKAVFPPQSIGASSGPEADTRKLAQPEKRAFHRSTQMEMPAIEQERSTVAAPPDRFSRLDALWSALPGRPIEQSRVLGSDLPAATDEQEEVAQQLVPERRSADPKAVSSPPPIEADSAEANIRELAQPEKQVLLKHSPASPLKPEHSLHDRLVRPETSKADGMMEDSDTPAQPIDRRQPAETGTALKPSALLIRDARPSGRDYLAPDSRPDVPTPGEAVRPSTLHSGPQPALRPLTILSQVPEVPASVPIELQKEAPADDRVPSQKKGNGARSLVAVFPASIVQSPRLPPTHHPPTPPDRTPAIQVTIGRVEVRATQTQPPAVRSRPSVSRPAMTLDEYLRERSGGGSR